MIYVRVKCLCTHKRRVRACCGVRHATYEFVMSQMNASRHMWICHVAYQCMHELIISHMNETYMCVARQICLTSKKKNDSYVICDWVASHMSELRSMWLRICISRITYECNQCVTFNPKQKVCLSKTDVREQKQMCANWPTLRYWQGIIGHCSCLHTVTHCNTL